MYFSEASMIKLYHLSLYKMYMYMHVSLYKRYMYMHVSSLQEVHVHCNTVQCMYSCE